MSLLAAGAWKVNQWWFLLRLIVCVWGGGGGSGGGWIRSSVEMLTAPFRPLHKRINLLSLLLFLREPHFSFSGIPSHTLSFKAAIASYKPSSLILNFFRFLVEEPGLGDPKHSCHIPKRGEQVPYMLPLLHPEDVDKDFVSGNHVLLAVVHMLLIRVFHLKSC